MDLVIPAITTLLGSGLTITGRYAIEYAKDRRRARDSDILGTWHQVIPAQGNRPERWDTVAVRQREDLLDISIERNYPEQENRRRWRATGFQKGNIVVALFYTTTRDEDSSSYGAILLHRDHEIRGHNVWRGFYTRPDATTLRQFKQGTVERHKLSWQREDPQNHVY